MFNKGVQEVITILYEKQGEKFMKVELQISETYEEEKLIVQAPQPTDKVQKVIEFAENLDLTEKIKGKIDNQVYLVEISKIQRFYIENRKVLAETASQTYTIDLRLYQVLEILPTNFIQISQSEIININSISHLKAHAQRSGRNFLENENFTYSSTPLPKNHQGEIRTMKKQIFHDAATGVLIGLILSIIFSLIMHQIPTHH